MTSSRRKVLKGALGAVVGCSFARFSSDSLAAGEIGIEHVAEGLDLLTGAGGNVLVRSMPSGRILVDSGAAEATDLLLAALDELPGTGRVERLFNTHWHLEQTGGNEAFGRAGARIVAHEKTRAHLATPYYLPAEDRYRPASPVEAQPTETFYTRGEAIVGGKRVEYGHLLEAHTDGDIYVHFRDANVIAVGDVVSPIVDPVLDWFGGGWLGGRVDSLDLLLELTDARTRFVPSYGPVIGRADVQAEREMMFVLFERMVELVRKGMSAEDILAEGVMDDLGRSFTDPLKFVHDAHKGLWAHHNTLSPDVV